MQFPNKTTMALPGGHALYLEQNEALYKAVHPFLKRFAQKS